MSTGTTSVKHLATQVLAENSADLVKQLYARIAHLEDTLTSLLAETAEDNYKLSDDSAHELATQFNHSLKDVDEKGLVNFGTTFLHKYPKYMRATIATVLKNKALELKVKPLDAWLDTIALDGEL